MAVKGFSSSVIQYYLATLGVENFNIGCNFKRF